MRTRPRPRNREAATATIRTRYIPLRNQSRLIGRGLVWGRLVRVLPVSAEFPLLGQHLVLVVRRSHAVGNFPHGLCQLFKALAESLVVLLPWRRGVQVAGAGPPYTCKCHRPGVRAQPGWRGESSKLGERLPRCELCEFCHWGRLVRRVIGLALSIVGDVRAGFNSPQSPWSSPDSLSRIRRAAGRVKHPGWVVVRGVGSNRRLVACFLPGGASPSSSP